MNKGKGISGWGVTGREGRGTHMDSVSKTHEAHVCPRREEYEARKGRGGEEELDETALRLTAEWRNI